MKEMFDQLSARCSKLTTTSYSTSFSFGIYFLGKQLRQPVYAIYGFVRLADEIVDSFHNFDKKYLLEKFKQDTFEAIELGISLNPVLNSFQKVVNEYQIDHKLIRLFLKSMEMDLEDQLFTEDLYQEYILGSAEVVGLMCLKVFTNGDEAEYNRLKPFAMKLRSPWPPQHTPHLTCATHLPTPPPPPPRQRPSSAIWARRRRRWRRCCAPPPPRSPPPP